MISFPAWPHTAGSKVVCVGHLRFQLMLALALLVSGTPRTLVAQSDPASSPPTNQSATQPVDDPSSPVNLRARKLRGEVENSIRSYDDESYLLKQVLQRGRPIITSELPGLTDDVTSAELLQRQQSKKLQRFRTELDQLLIEIDMLEDKQLSSQPNSMPAMPPVEDNTTGNTRSAEPKPPGLGSSQPAEQPNEQPDQQTPVDERAQVLLQTDPLDKLAMADNLTAAGNYQLALKIYLGVIKAPKTKLSAESLNWVRYQAAVCYKNLRQYEEARQLFRVVTNSGVKDQTTSLATWWLDQIDSLQQMQTSLELMDRFLRDNQVGN